MQKRDIGLGLLLGVALAFAFVWTLGFTLAIAAPGNFLGEAASTDLFRLFVWDVFVVNGLGVGVIAIAVAVLLSWIDRWAAFRICFVAAPVTWVVAHFVVPVVHASPPASPFTRPWWGYGFEIMLALGLVIVPWLIARRSKP